MAKMKISISGGISIGIEMAAWRDINQQRKKQRSGMAAAGMA